jgi:alpha-methylacyl-CoA racemase
MLALEKIRVLDLTRVGPGAFCTMILGDMGAEVLKIESPPSLKDRRQAGAFHSPSGDEGRREAAFNPVDRNKKSVAINLQSAAGRKIFYRLIKQSDVAVSAFRPGVAKRLKIDYHTLSAINPRIICCAISGYGQEGPYKNLAGHDANYTAMSGALNLIGEAGRKPALPLTLVGDRGGSAQRAAIGILKAIIARHQTGRGQLVDISIMDSIIALLAWPSITYFYHGIVPERGTTTDQGAYPYYGVYETKDGKYISIGCIEPWHWEKLLKEIDREEYASYHFQRKHLFLAPNDEKWQAITTDLEKVFRTRTRDEWFDIFVARDIPVGKVQSLDEVFSDPQVLKREMVIEIDDPEFGKIRQIGIPTKLSETPGAVRSLSPTFGQHTAEILNCLGYNQETIDELYKNNTVA